MAAATAAMAVAAAPGPKEPYGLSRAGAPSDGGALALSDPIIDDKHESHTASVSGGDGDRDDVAGADHLPPGGDPPFLADCPPLSWPARGRPRSGDGRAAPRHALHLA